MANHDPLNVTWVELHGGPLDGSHAPVDPTDPAPWTAIISERCRYPGGRSVYAPGPDGVWRWERDVPWEEL